MGVDDITDYDPTKPAKLYFLKSPDFINLKYYDTTKTQNPQGLLFPFPNKCGLHGYQNPYSP